MLKTNSVALTTDLWTTKNLINSYLCLTAHFYDDENTKSFANILLGLQVINENHSGENIKLCIEKILNKYESPIKDIIRIVTDNGSNMIKALKVLNQIEYQNAISFMEKVIDEVASGKLFAIECNNLSENNDREISWEIELIDIESEINEYEIKDREISSEFSNFAKRLPCYVHTLQLVVNVILKSKSIRSIADKVRHLSAKINKSTPAIQKFKKKINCKPPSDCPTRWSSLYLMFIWFVKHQKSIIFICESESWDHFSVTEWSIIEKIAKFLQLFAIHTNLIQGENYITLSNVLPSIIELTHHIENFIATKVFPDNKILQEMKNQMQNRFSKNQTLIPIILTQYL